MTDDKIDDFWQTTHAKYLHQIWISSDYLCTVKRIAISCFSLPAEDMGTNEI